MDVKGRALFNYLRMNWEEDPSIVVEPWQVEDYRQLSEEELYQRLEALGIALDHGRFLGYAAEAPSPEELIETLWVDESEENLDNAYLLLFELWRRLLPGRQSLSIFCDELDHLIDHFDRGTLENEEAIQNALSDLQGILDEQSDRGEGPKALFREISLYCAHDLESFIYDFSSKQIDEGNSTTASELIDGFSLYITDKKWFDFLQQRLISPVDGEEAEHMLLRLFEELEGEPDFDLLLEIARQLVNKGSVSHFIRAVLLARGSIQSEQDFQELLALTSEFYRLLDHEVESKELALILKERQGNDLDAPLSPDEDLVRALYDLFEDLEGSEV
ncbi:MAG: hypothetical protein KR126chlam1_01325 [Chlamydiae bacterium]|nr:hypothetical protein [Chlamydiota bacterium]